MLLADDDLFADLPINDILQALQAEQLEESNDKAQQQLQEAADAEAMARTGITARKTAGGKPLRNEVDDVGAPPSWMRGSTLFNGFNVGGAARRSSSEGQTAAEKAAASRAARAVRIDEAAALARAPASSSS